MPFPDEARLHDRPRRPLSGYDDRKAVIRSWAQFLGVAALAVAMLGAPCRDCFPREEAKAPCGHDCCPKPKPARESKPCSWQPAGFDALESAKHTAAPELVAVLLPAAIMQAAPVAPCSERVCADWHAPPPPAPPASLPPLRI